MNCLCLAESGSAATAPTGAPAQAVRYRFNGVSDEERGTFMRYFAFYKMRDGGLFSTFIKKITESGKFSQRSGEIPVLEAPHGCIALPLPPTAVERFAAGCQNWRPLCALATSAGEAAGAANQIRRLGGETAPG